jgi:hypothetical protein
MVWLFSVVSKANRNDPQAAAKRLRNQAQSFGAWRSSSLAYRTRKAHSGTTLKSTTSGLR